MLAIVRLTHYFNLQCTIVDHAVDHVDHVVHLVNLHVHHLNVVDHVVDTQSVSDPCRQDTGETLRQSSVFFCLCSEICRCTR